MPFVYDEEGNLRTQEVDGKPVPMWQKDENANPAPFDADKAISKISALNDESKSWREKLETTQEQMKVLDNVKLGEEEKLEDWIKKAQEAIQTVANFKESDFVKAEEVEKIKKSVADVKDKEANALKESLERVVDGLKQKVGEREGYLRKLLIENAISNAPVLQKTIFGELPETAISMFGGNFEVDLPENGGLPKVIAKDSKGEKIYSSGQNPGELADVNEALEYLITGHPKKEKLLLDSRKSGSGVGEPGNVDVDRPEANFYSTMS